MPPIQPCDLIISAQEILFDKQSDQHNVDCMAIHQGNIVCINTLEHIQQHWQATQTIKLPHHIISPGLINTHGHSAMSLLRGYADDMPLMQWLEEKIWPTEAAFVNEEFVYQGTQLAIAEMIRSGTTTFSDMYFFPEACAQAVQESGMRAQLSFPVFDFPSNWGTGPDDYLSKGENLMRQFQNNELIQVIPGPHAPYTVSDEALTASHLLAKKYHCGIQMHLHETEFEVQTALAETGKRPLERLEKLGLLDDKFQAVHMTYLNEADIELCKDSQLSVIHCPESNLKLASGFCPIQKLSDAGINVALGTDGAASNNDLDMFGEMRTASLLSKAVSKLSTSMNAQSSLHLATINGAKALNLEQVTGSLSVGKAADFIAIDIKELEQQPLYSALSMLTYSNISPRVSHSYVNGVCLMENYQFTPASNLDSSTIISNAKTWQKAISKTDQFGK